MARASRELKKTSLMLVSFVLLQICLGIGNVIFYVPPLLAILHQAVGVTIFYWALRQSHLASKPKRQCRGSWRAATSKVEVQIPLVRNCSSCGSGGQISVITSLITS